MPQHDIIEITRNGHKVAVEHLTFTEMIELSNRIGATAKTSLPALVREAGAAQSGFSS